MLNAVYNILDLTSKAEAPSERQFLGFSLVANPSRHPEVPLNAIFGTTTVRGFASAWDARDRDTGSAATCAGVVTGIVT